MGGEHIESSTHTFLIPCATLSYCIYLSYELLTRAKNGESRAVET